jgi:hypothetical protein
VWLQDQFAKADLDAVPRLVKLVERKEIENALDGKRDQRS